MEINLEDKKHLKKRNLQISLFQMGLKLFQDFCPKPKPSFFSKQKTKKSGFGSKDLDQMIPRTSVGCRKKNHKRGKKNPNSC